MFSYQISDMRYHLKNVIEMGLGPSLQGVLLDWKKGNGKVCTLSRSQGHGAYLSSDATSSEFQKSLMFGVVKHKLLLISGLHKLHELSS